MMTKPVLSNPKRVPMAKSLYDDFVAVHYTSFKNTHLTVSCLAHTNHSWHRCHAVSTPG